MLMEDPITRLKNKDKIVQADATKMQPSNVKLMTLQQQAPIPSVFDKMMMGVKFNPILTPYEPNKKSYLAEGGKVDPPKKKVSLLTLLNPVNWGVKDHSDQGTFGKAFAKARESKEEDFFYDGKKYNTKVKPTVEMSQYDSFNTVFKQAKDSGEKEFLYKGKKYNTKLVSPEVDQNYKDSKNYLKAFLYSQPMSLTSADSVAAGNPEGIKQMQQSDRDKALKSLDKPGYFSITKEPVQGNVAGVYNPASNRIYINEYDGYTSIHELTHKANLATKGNDRERLLANLSKDPKYLKAAPLKDIDYLLDPHERASRHLVTKYYLSKQGKNDKLTSEDYKKLYNDDAAPNNVQELLYLYKDEKEFLNQLNTPVGYDNEAPKFREGGKIMADGGSFETKQPETFSKEGVNLRDLIRFAAGKAEGEEVTKDDFGNLLNQSGVSRKDARRLTKAYDTIEKNTNLDYILSTSGDSFNVFDKTTGEALTRSSRKTGSTKGATFADLVKLGDNVSTLAGFAGNKIGDYIKPKGELQDQGSADKTPNVTPPTQATDPATLKTTKKKGTDTESSKGSAPASKPLDGLLSDPSMRNFLLNPDQSKVSYDTTNDLPPVELPTVDKETARMALAPDDKKLQREYSSQLRNNFASTYEYLTGKDANPSNSKKLQISGELGKIKSKQSPMYQYLMKYHKKELDKLTSPNLQINGTN